MPQLKHFEVDGVTYPLPLLAKEWAGPTRELTRPLLEYLAGFFDGNGCVCMSRKSLHNSGRLSMSQSLPCARILLLFRDAFGGSISAPSAETGRKAAMLQWQLPRHWNQGAATLLARVPSMKQELLRLAATGLPSADEDRAVFCAKLPDLKLQGHLRPLSAAGPSSRVEGPSWSPSFGACGISFEISQSPSSRVSRSMVSLIHCLCCQRTGLDPLGS